MVRKREGKRYHDAKEMFDSAYTLIKKTKHQFRQVILYWIVANNVTNNYCSYQSLYDFIRVSLISTAKEPTRFLNKICDLTNDCVPINKKGYVWIRKATYLY